MKPTQVTQEPNFEVHMREKATTWDAFEVIIGDDFAVFEFDSKEARDIVKRNLDYYQDVYGYTSHTGGHEQLVILKGK